ncbi:hypothetical protein VTI74DRAFT_8837 [Chaetomium olivicolor]
MVKSTAVAAVLAVLACPALATATDGRGQKCPSRFAWENAHLTEAAIAASDASLFRFGDGATTTSTVTSRTNSPKCKLLPGDPSWPSPRTWSVFNATLNGALIQTVPLAAPCYANWPSHYNPAACSALRAQWSDPHLHVADPSSAMFPLYQGRTCMPTDDPHASNCTLGAYAAYSVAATEVRDIQLALNFARNVGLRLVVKNTGHDFADKSIGAGALSVWTHRLKDIEFLGDYDCRGYKGPAFRLGAGVETEEVYRAAEENGVTAVGGECRTVGLAGGYTAGGGHSPMSALVGMAADQVLSMDVVLPNGRFVTVHEDAYPDLYWALRGGGGSTYGVVTSVTIRAYPKVPVTTMTFAFTTSPTISTDTFFAGFRAYMTYFDAFTRAGAYGYFLVTSIGPGQYLFSMNPMWGSNVTLPEFSTLVAPFLTDLRNLNISLTPNITTYPSFYTAFTNTFPPEQVGTADNHAASRLFPRENFLRPAKLKATLATVRHAVENGGVLIGYNIRAAPNPSVNQANAVNPAWRRATGFFILAATWPDNATTELIQQASETLTNDWMERWRAVSPGGGAYMSEGDINEPDWRGAFYGEYYDRLLELKKRYDPTGLFYAPTAVGSEEWEVLGQVDWIPGQNGRLCRKG